MRSRLAVVAAALLLAAPAGSQVPPFSPTHENPSSMRPATATMRQSAPAFAPPDVAAVAPLITLAPAADVEPDRVRELGEWNRSGGVPRKTGLVRSVEPARRLALSGATAAGVTDEVRRTDGMLRRDGADVVWIFRVDVAGGHRVRAHLRDLTLPPGTRLFAYGADRVLQGPMPIAASDVWTPTVDGGSLAVVLRMPMATLDASATYAVAVDRMLEEIALDADGMPATASRLRPALVDHCIADYACVTGIPPLVDAARTAIGRMTFIEDSFSYKCTGGLLNDKDPSGFIPYFLTANHCIASEAVAATLEVRWDYRSTSCGGLPASSGTTFGATLLATSPDTDFTLLRLADDPPGERLFLGWTTAEPSGNLFRLHHPGGEVLHVSEHVPVPSPETCEGLPSSRFLYTYNVFSSTRGGSSGSPLLDAEARVVGQLYGACGPNVDDACDPSNRTVDGRFARTFPAIAAWIDGGATTTTTSTPTTTTLPVPPGICNCHQSGFHAFKKCVRAAFKALPKFERKAAKAAVKLANKAACGKSRGKKKAVRCCAAAASDPAHLIDGPVCALVPARQCWKLGGTIEESASCTTACSP
jgi:hypothetical protein